jgi:hypothetical protein
MSTLNDFNTITTPMLERHLAVIQMKHYLHLKQSAESIGDHHEYRRATDIIDKLTTEYGVSALNEAQDELP